MSTSVDLQGMVRKAARLTSVLATLFIIGTAGFTRVRADQGVLRVADHKGGWHPLMEAAGELKSVPYQVEWPQFAGGAPIIEAMNADAVDIGAMSDAPFLFGYASGAPVKAIEALQANPELVGILVPAGSALKSIADIKGKRIAAVRGSVSNFYILASLQDQGLALDAAQIIPLDGADARAALSAGAVDGWCTWEPYISIGEESGGLRVLPRNDHIETGSVFLLATDSALKTKQELLRDFVSRLHRAYQWAADHPDAYASIFAKDTGLSLAAAQRFIHRVKYRFRPLDQSVISDEKRLVDLFKQSHLLRPDADFSDAYARDFH